MPRWWDRLFGRGQPEEAEEIEGAEEPVDLDLEERVARLEDRVQRLDERTRKQRYREEQADVAPRQVPNGAIPGGRKSDLMRAFRIARGGTS